MDYQEYRKQVVDECTRINGNREFWETQCSFEEEFTRGDDPIDVAAEQVSNI